jgi:hypothetical protein
MRTLTRTLTISTLTAALAGGFGLAQAQSASTGNGSTGNPDPNATLGVTSPTDNSNPNVDRMRQPNRNIPGALQGEAGETDATKSYAEPRTEPGSMEFSQHPTDQATRGEAARSNNSYGNSRTTPQSEER